MRITVRIAAPALAAALCLLPLSGYLTSQTAPRNPGTEFMVSTAETGRPGGRLVASLRAEPKTLNPVTFTDAASKLVIWRMMADLVHINRYTQQPEPALAKSWTVSPDGRKYTLKLRRGLRFSDGLPLTADDVVFSFRVYLDESVHAPQRDLLIVSGKPISVKKIDAGTVLFELAAPYGPGLRLFDGFAILPSHLLEGPYHAGRLAEVWSPASPPTEIAGAGPFRLKEYVSGQRLVLEKNPFYWKQDQKGVQLPYLNELVFLFIPNEDSQVLRFQSGDIDMISRVSALNFSMLQGKASTGAYSLQDAGPSLEWNFLFFNLNDLSKKNLPQISGKQKWFANPVFRQAVSLAADREGMVRLVYQGRATPIWSPVTPGNKQWFDQKLPHPARSIDQARQLLGGAGFSWNSEGTLLDPQKQPVEFSIVVSSSNLERGKMSTIIQDDLRQLGMRVTIVPLESRALLSRVLDTGDYEASVLGLASGDADPNADSNVWLSDGSTHLWDLHRDSPATPWEAEVDASMRKQLTDRTFEERKKEFDHVQEILAENHPLIFLVSPHVLVAAKTSLGNFHPAVLDPVDLWNVEEFFWKSK
jgi:peptide/nickel transport system substrate-binding protein